MNFLKNLVPKRPFTSLVLPSRPKVMSTVDSMKARYTALCEQRDATNARVAPLLAQREELAVQADALTQEAKSLSAQIDAIRGGESWLAMKKEIGMLAKALSGIR